MVRDRRLEAVQQIAVRAVQFDQIETEPVGAASRRSEGVADAVESVLVQRLRAGPIRGKRDRRRAKPRPRPFATAERVAARPWHMRRGLATGMRQLDAEFGV